MNSLPTEDPSPIGDATTLDQLLGGRLRLRQPARGHRAGTDAVLLAAFAEPPPGGTVVDLGAGVGTIGLMLALADRSLTVILVEHDPRYAALARENVDLNGLAGRVVVEQRDAFDAGPTPRADLVVCNPPFYAAAESRPSPDALRAGAHHLGDRGHAAWLQAAVRHGGPRGTVAMIHRPEALPDLLAGRGTQAGGFVLRPVHPRDGMPARRVLLRIQLGSRAPLRLEPALVLHRPEGGFTPEAEAMHAGAWLQTHESRPEGRLSSVREF